VAKGEIHDLGYQRYVGPRRPPATRWRVIMRHQIATAWKTWWRYKAALGFAVVMTCVWGGLLFFASTKVFQMGGGQGVTLFFSEAALPMSIEWYCRAAFYLSLTLGAGAIAGDLQSGAFTFYFARSMRPRDYVFGKLAGYGILVATLVALGPLVLAGLRLGICDTTDELVAHLWIVPAALAVGAVMTVAYAVIPLGFSAIVADRRNALALWAAYYLIFGFAMSMIGRFSGGPAGALDLPTACLAVAFDLFDFHPLFGRRAARQLSSTTALISILIHAAVAIGILWWRVSRAQKQGVGGSG
jgi:ABC-2 type transport system permease protein